MGTIFAVLVLLQEPAALLEKAESAYGAGRFEAAEALYRQVLDENPGGPHEGTSRFNLGQCLMARRRFEAAREAFQQLIDSNVNDADPSPDIMELQLNYRPRAIRRIAASFEKEGDWERALDSYLKAKDGYPAYNGCGNCGHAGVLADIEAVGRCLERLGRDEEALAHYEPVLFGQAFLADADSLVVAGIDAAIRVGVLRSLEKRLTDSLENEERPTRAAWAFEYLEILRLGADGNVEALFNRFVELAERRVSSSCWRWDWDEFGRRGGRLAKEAAEALGRIGDSTIDALLPIARGGGPTARWAWIAISNVKSEKARAVIDDFAAEGTSEEGVRMLRAVSTGFPPSKRPPPPPPPPPDPPAGAAATGWGAALAVAGIIGAASGAWKWRRARRAARRAG